MNAGSIIGPPASHGALCQMLALLGALALLGGSAVMLTRGRTDMSAAARRPLSPADILNIGLDHDGRCSSQGQIIAPPDLAETLRQFGASRRAAGVRIRIPRDLPVPVLLEFMRTLKSCGIEHSTVDIAAP